MQEMVATLNDCLASASQQTRIASTTTAAEPTRATTNRSKTRRGSATATTGQSTPRTATSKASGSAAAAAAAAAAAMVVAGGTQVEYGSGGMFARVLGRQQQILAEAAEAERSDRTRALKQRSHRRLVRRQSFVRSTGAAA